MGCLSGVKLQFSSLVSLEVKNQDLTLGVTGGFYLVSMFFLSPAKAFKCAVTTHQGVGPLMAVLLVGLGVPVCLWSRCLCTQSQASLPLLEMGWKSHGFSWRKWLYGGVCSTGKSCWALCLFIPTAASLCGLARCCATYWSKLGWCPGALSSCWALERP